MRRDGFLYVAVLFTSLVVMVAVTAALAISTSTLRSENDRTSRGDALWVAESEVQRQLAIIKRGNAWRTDHANDTFVDWHAITFNGASIGSDLAVRHRFTDEDGDLADDDFDPVRLTVHARVGNSHAAVSVDLEPDPIPLDLLRYAITAADDAQFNDGYCVTTERPVQVVDDCKGDAASILTTPRLESGGSIAMTLRGEWDTAKVDLPSRDVVARYISIGTEIPADSVPRDGADLLIDRQLLTPTDNPFGPVDASGIYWIDAGGERLRITDSRIEATLAITNCSLIEIGGGIVWRYPGSAEVILATNTDVILENIEPTLEESIVGVNFNPTSSPFRGNLSNVTTTDVYPTELRGILYTTGNVRIYPKSDGSALHVVGSIIGRDLIFDGHLVVHSLDELWQTPPAGLCDPTPMRLIRGSYRRIPTP